MGLRSAAGASLLLLVTLAGVPASHAASFTVDDTGEASDADTLDPACATAGATCTLRAAIEQSNALGGAAHVITLPAGTYEQSATLPSIGQDITIAGAGAATTIVRASDTGRPRLLDVPAGGTLRLQGVTLTNAAVGPGSAIRATGGDVVITSCVVSGNAGGAVQGAAVASASITATGTTFSGNTSGSALEASDSYDLAVEGCVFDANHQTSFGLGGAIAVTGSGTSRQHTITLTTFTANTAGGGGAVSLENVPGTVAIASSTFSGNTTASYAGYGGAAILSFEPGLAISDTNFLGNAANGPSQNGGAILSPQIGFTCTGCTFDGNGATATGGAICATGMTILNSTFTGNTAGSSGGAIYVDNPALPNALALGNATVSGNTAAAGGGLRAGSASVVVKNSIIAGNTAPTGPDCLSTVTSQGHNLIGNGSACSFATTTGDQVGTAATPIAPGLAAIANNGGPTRTMALVAGSPAIDAGDPAGCSDFAQTVLATDQRGSLRPADGDGVGGAVCDIGAYELDGVPTSSTTSSTIVVPSTSTTTSTTLPPPVCAGGVAIERPVLVVRKIAPPAGDEALVFKGALRLAAGDPTFFEPRERGAQVLVEDLGSGEVAVFELSHRTTPVPPGAGCDSRDGWTRTRYANVSGRIDPPACTAGSANGLRSLRFKDRRRKGKGIAFVVTTKGSSLGVPVGPFRGTIVLGASVVASASGECGVHTFAPAACTTKRGTIRCR
jgi:predicted outer membrane repeat protein